MIHNCKHCVASNGFFVIQTYAILLFELCSKKEMNETRYNNILIGKVTFIYGGLESENNGLIQYLRHNINVMPFYKVLNIGFSPPCCVIDLSPVPHDVRFYSDNRYVMCGWGRDQYCHKK